MELAPANIELTFEVTFDANNLNVGMSVYDTTSSMPTLVQGPLAMANVIGNTYIGKFTGNPGQTYLIFKAVYTDGTFTTLDTDYSQGSESIVCEIVGQTGQISDNAVVGLVNEPNPIVGLVNC